MHEDKLTHDERLRLECLAQAVALHPMAEPGMLACEASQ